MNIILHIESSFEDAYFEYISFISIISFIAQSVTSYSL